MGKEVRSTEDLFQPIKDQELASIFSEYIIRNIGDNEYRYKDTFNYTEDFLSGSKKFSINYREGRFYYLSGVAVAPGRKKPGNEIVEINGSFPGEISYEDSSVEIIKSFWNGEHAVYEQYTPTAKRIIAKVYTAETIDEYSKSCGFYNARKQLISKKKEISDISNIGDFKPADETIIVVATDSGEFYAVVCDANNNAEPFYIEGSSLYDAYYNYMVDKGYFTEDDQKTGRRPHGHV